MLAILLAAIILTASGSIVVNQYNETIPTWNLTETPYDDKDPATIPCDATEAEFHDLQCPPKK